MNQPGKIRSETVMKNISIRVVGISKRYHVGTAVKRYDTLRDTIAAKVPNLLKRVSRRSSAADEPNEPDFIWSLRDVSFDVAEGAAVGIIGRNGAGKSTLLKVLSRITDPTCGYAEVRGRVGSLLEVGTGFHQELTGRENIFLNAAILGMKRGEILKKFDQIISFAEVERFVDTPVKHYSSGMYLRLAFGVAAHLDPHVLLVDEVLAVGDAVFQKKCLGKMEETAKEGRTVLFVSHNLAAIKHLCKTCLLLNKGKLEFMGPSVEAIARYSMGLIEPLESGPSRSGRWEQISINGHPGAFAASISRNDSILIEAFLMLPEDVSRGLLYCALDDAMGGCVFHQRIGTREVWGDCIEAGRYRVTLDMPPIWLAPGLYTLHLKFIGSRTNGKDERFHSERLLLNVEGTTEGLSRASLAPPCKWEVVAETPEPCPA